jgi:hypothetical protein
LITIGTSASKGYIVQFVSFISNTTNNNHSKWRPGTNISLYLNLNKYSNTSWILNTIAYVDGNKKMDENQIVTTNIFVMLYNIGESIISTNIRYIDKAEIEDIEQNIRDNKVLNRR